MRALLAATLLAACLGAPARAETLLRLSESARVSVPPDELAVTVAASALAPTAAEAQARVNAAAARAVAAAKAVPGMVVSTGSYNVWRQSQPREQWQASQSIDMRAKDGQAVLKLVGALQADGLSVSRLGWRLSDDATRKARSEALKVALGAIEGRAKEAAALLGLRFDSFRTVRLDSPHPIGPLPAPRAMAMAAAAAPPPVAEAEDVPVEATVEADAVLVPK